jgi:hypothetical protein
MRTLGTGHMPAKPTVEVGAAGEVLDPPVQHAADEPPTK